MKRLVPVFCFLVGLMALKAQPVITEIMYNPPESGADSLEYIEIYNGTGAAVDMTGWTLSTAVNFTFPSLTLSDNQHIVIAGNDTAFMNVFGFLPLQWNSGSALNNTGEAIELKNSNGDLMDIVAYSSGNGWPSLATGQGSSLELCNFLAENNDPNVWVASANATGIVVNSIEIKASPGVFNDAICPSEVVYNIYDIGQVTGVNADGIADSVGVNCQLTGTVYGVNLRPTGLQFTLIDQNNDGINVFYPTGNFNYTVLESNKITVQGGIGQFNGLIQINPDTIWIEIASSALFPPTLVTTLGEATESQLVRINGLTLVDPLQWLTGQGTGFAVDVTNGTNTFVMRIDNDVDLFNLPAPIGSFDAIGLGSQFDDATPFTEGYSFMPRYFSDIILNTNELIVNDDQASTNQEEAIVITVNSNDFYPNTVTSFTITQAPASGTATITNAANYEITYVPAAGFCGDDMFTYEVCDAGGCETGVVSIEVICQTDIPQYDIGIINTENADGVADSIGVECSIRGIVYGVNMRPAGLQFTLIDASGDGMGVFSSSNNFGYVVNEGDDITVTGIIEQFNGLTQIVPSDVVLHSSGNTLLNAATVTDLNEGTESKLVKITNLIIENPGDWTNTGSGFNVAVTDGNNTYTMRIDADVDIFGTNAPTVPFTLTGLGGQFDSSSPYTTGYQLFPRYLSDIDLSNATSVVRPAIAVSISPNPASTEATISAELTPDTIEIYSLTGNLMEVIKNPEANQRIRLRLYPDGIYQVKLRFGNQVVSKQLVVMK